MMPKESQFEVDPVSDLLTLRYAGKRKVISRPSSYQVRQELISIICFLKSFVQNALEAAYCNFPSLPLGQIILQTNDGDDVLDVEPELWKESFARMRSLLVVVKPEESQREGEGGRSPKLEAARSPASATLQDGSSATLTTSM